MFKILKKSKLSQARIGKLKTPNGVIDTPFFMPDATRACIRSLSSDDLNKINMGPMVVNTYHLNIQPGIDIIKKIGGINRMMDWNKPLLSDSGGYQIFSLIHRDTKAGKITNKGVVFKSYLNGLTHDLSPEKAIKIQFDLAVDMMVCLDDPSPNEYSKIKIEKAIKRTIIWAKRCKSEYNKQIKKRKIKDTKRPLLFGVIQGGNYPDLRKYCAEELIKIGFDGYGFGARHIDQHGNFLKDVLAYTADLIPDNVLRFALGVGKPEDIVRCVYMGWDMFDCVIPTREARHGRLYVKKIKNQKSKIKNIGYKIINITNSRFKNDLKPLDANCGCELCKNYSKAYLHHLFKIKDDLAKRLATIHNLKFYLNLMKELRQDIKKGEL